MSLVFYFLGFLSVFFSFLIMISVHPIYSLLYLILLICAIAGIFFTLGANFIGALSVVMYAGAIMVLFVFVIMMIKNHIQNIYIKPNWSMYFYEILDFICTMIIFFILWIQIINEKNKILFFNTVFMKNIGICLFNKYFVLVEFVSLFLLASLLVVCFFLK
ncbi:NADH-quinone oxidoreductase subunit J [Buchnera aphidicola]|uniref:NADH-quinone oxidoreductase subunit J n=1 Tax=Buchnera aphidicola (Cinara cf. splendens/pseudotsugae 3390) TaxID=2518980 RepID=A0A451CWI0_9GAMM|nr:NADH-quinone oxidoreductase subunit J [Buchnera aphidicola]VFP77682.1 NADH-quinone oxidoreductase subunit J [Buchnera aphidicola (Cinara cf. splendens/pseudotsugae 3390)]